MTSPATLAARQHLADSDLKDEIRRLLAERVHSIRQDLSGDITLASALAMKKHLEGRPFKEGTEAPVENTPAPSRPSARITEEGMYYYNKTVYKVIKSQYSGHWQARRFDPVTSTFTFAPGMMSVLRAEHAMTAADSIEFEALYGVPMCTDCGRPLENDVSRERRKGPVCFAKNGP